MAGIVADRVVVELEARLDRYEANLRRAEQRFDATSRGVQRSAQQLEKSVLKSSTAIGSTLRNLAGTFAAAFSAQQVAQFADAYTRFTNQLKVAGVEGANLAIIQTKLFNIGQQYGQQLEGLGTLYSRGSQVAKELGANQEQLIQFTEGVAAALKIQGTSAVESRGALLQLSQLLSTGTVRAEEFNSVNEGALPILQAVAKNIDAAGGSVGKLKLLVNDGKITSEAFFQAFLKGSEQLKTQASSANTTIAQSFVILQNALTKYIGEADKSLGVTQLVSGALIALSQNLGTVAVAVGLLAAVMVGRLAASMVAGAASTGVFQAALFAMQARAIGAATTMEALGFAGRAAGSAMLGAFGGPVGLAVAALAVGIGYLVSAQNDATQASEELKASINEQTQQFAGLKQKQDESAAASNKLTGEQRATLTAVASLTGEVDLLANAWARVAAQAKAAQIEQARAAYMKATQNVVDAGTAYLGDFRARKGSRMRDNTAERGIKGGPVYNDQQAGAIAFAETKGSRKVYEQARDNRRLAGDALREVESRPLATFKPAYSGSGSGSGTGKKTGRSGGAGPKPTDPDKIARRFEDDLARGYSELQTSLAEATGTAKARRDAEIARIEADRASTERSIMADKDYSDLQKTELVDLNNLIAIAKKEAILAQERVDAAEAALTIQTGDINNQRDLLEAQSRLVTTAGEKRDIELRILDLQYEEERLRLEAIVNNTRLNDAERELARRRLAMLGDLQTLDKQNVERQNEGVKGRYLRDLNGKDIKEQLDQVRVDGLGKLEDKLVDVTSEIFKMGGAFGEVANQIIADLLRIAIQQAIIKPLANALFGGDGSSGGGGGGGNFGAILGSLAGAFGGGGGGGGGSSLGAGLALAGARASGGHVNAGQIYRVNEKGVEGFKPAGSGKIIPLGQMKQAMGRSVILNQKVHVDARGSVNPDGYADHIVASVRRETIGIVAAGMKRVDRNVPQRVAQYQTDGT